MKLRIEATLKKADIIFFQKYSLMRERLLNVEYEHWAAGFPQGNNHGRGHIRRVLENLDNLLGPIPLQSINEYELFLSMMSILYHDIGMLRQRKGHEMISGELLKGDEHDSYIVNPIDKQIITAAVVSHSSSQHIEEQCSKFSATELVGPHNARPRVVAALVRLADELDEDHRRADPLLQRRLDLERLYPESVFFWLFCQRVRGVRPNLAAKQIDFNLAFENEDTTKYGSVPGGRMRSFIAFSAEKLAKINGERVYVNRFLPQELQYAGLHLDLKPLPENPTWTEPKTFVFNDVTTSDMLLNGIPELLYDPLRRAIQNILELMRDEKLDEAEKELDKLFSVRDDLPLSIQMPMLYERTCILSMKAEKVAKCAAKTTEIDDLLDSCTTRLAEWFEQGRSGGWDAIARTEAAEVHRMANDGDLAFVIQRRREKIQEAIPSLIWPKAGGGGGCIQMGTRVDTPNGPRDVQDLRQGDTVISLRLRGRPDSIPARIVAIATSRTTRCICLNESLMATPVQPICTPSGWVEAAALSEGDSVVNRHGQFVKILSVKTVDGYFEIFDLTVDDPAHNYIGGGLLCHNKTPPAGGDSSFSGADNPSSGDWFP
jgi:hypothetical protein